MRDIRKPFLLRRSMAHESHMGDLDVINIGELFDGETFHHGAAVSIRNGRVVSPRTEPVVRQIDAGERLVTPGLVEPHAHPIFAGSRGREFDLRAQGKTYLE